jgi:hypothetical protein
MILPEALAFCGGTRTGTGMPRASAPPSCDDPKPSGDRRFKGAMQTSIHPPAPGAGYATVQSSREFDLWLQRELCRLHGDVLHEPVPKRLLRILEEGLRPRD